MKQTIILSLVHALAAVAMFAQGPGPQTLRNRALLIEYGDRFYADAYVVPTQHKDSADIAVFFRMANDFLTFTRVPDPNEVRGNFSAPMAVSIELRDTLGVIRQRVRWKGDAFANSYEETNSKTDFHYGWQRLTVGPGTYIITIEILTQKESQQKKLKLPPVSFTPKRRTRQLTPPVFGEPVIVNGRDMVRLFVFSNNIPFGGTDARAFVLVADTVSTEYTYRITQEPWDTRDIRWWRVSEIDGTVRSERDRFPRVATASSTDAAYLEMVRQAVPERPIAACEIPIPLVNLVPGRYRLTLVARGSQDTIAMPFQIVWEMMPFSLRTLDYAINALEYICTEETIDSLSDGSAAENRERLMGWWRGQDPTPATVVNERMNEYYRRVDNAYFGFSSVAEPDGARTDRGKVYILYGPPATVDKDLKGKMPREIWTYTSGVKKTFVFEANEAGRLKLVDVR